MLMMAVVLVEYTPGRVLDTLMGSAVVDRMKCACRNHCMNCLRLMMMIECCHSFEIFDNCIRWLFVVNGHWMNKNAEILPAERID